MTRDNLLFGIIGILLGFIGGFLLAGNITQREAAMRANPQSAQSGSLPANHPPVGGDQATTGEGGQQMLASVQTAMKQARELVFCRVTGDQRGRALKPRLLASMLLSPARGEDG